MAGLLAAALLNLPLRLLWRMPGLLVNLLVATLVAAGIALAFHLRHQRRPTAPERRRILLLYGGGMTLLYATLLAVIEWHEVLGHAGLLLLILNYLCYPVMACWILRASTAD